jgi:hypothetical protein
MHLVLLTLLPLIRNLTVTLTPTLMSPTRAEELVRREQENADEQYAHQEQAKEYRQERPPLSTTRSVSETIGLTKIVQVTSRINLVNWPSVGLAWPAIQHW